MKVRKRKEHGSNQDEHGKTHRTHPTCPPQQMPAHADACSNRCQHRRMPTESGRNDEEPPHDDDGNENNNDLTQPTNGIPEMPETSDDAANERHPRDARNKRPERAKTDRDGMSQT